MYPTRQLLRFLLRASGILRGIGIVLPVYLIPQLLRFLVWTSGILRGRDSSTRVSYNTAVQVPTMDPRYSQR